MLFAELGGKIVGRLIDVLVGVAVLVVDTVVEDEVVVVLSGSVGESVMGVVIVGN